MAADLLRPGDRVHFPGDPTDVGTVTREGDHPDFVVFWDRCQPGDRPDVDECWPDGTLTTIESKRRLVLAHRHTSYRTALRREEWARARFWRLMKAADAAEGVAHVGR